MCGMNCAGAGCHWQERAGAGAWSSLESARCQANKAAAAGAGVEWLWQQLPRVHVSLRLTLSSSFSAVAFYVAAIEDATFSHKHLPYLESARACLSAVTKTSPSPSTSSSSSPSEVQSSLILPSLPSACAVALGVCICRHWISCLSHPSPTSPSASSQPALCCNMRALCLHVSHVHIPVLHCIARCALLASAAPAHVVMQPQRSGCLHAELGGRS
jgi:hypothetical protein